MDQPSLEHLADGLSSPFWEWFSAHVTREWGPSGLRYQQVVRAASENPQAVIELQKVLATQDAIYALMKHPADLLARMREQKKAELGRFLGQAASRRGPGL